MYVCILYICTYVCVYVSMYMYIVYVCVRVCGVHMYVSWSGCSAYTIHHSNSSFKMPVFVCSSCPRPSLRLHLFVSSRIHNLAAPAKHHVTAFSRNTRSWPPNGKLMARKSRGLRRICCWKLESLTKKKEPKYFTWHSGWQVIACEYYPRTPLQEWKISSKRVPVACGKVCAANGVVRNLPSPALRL